MAERFAGYFKISFESQSILFIIQAEYFRNKPHPI